MGEMFSHGFEISRPSIKSPIDLTGEVLPIPNGANYDGARGTVAEAIELYAKLVKYQLVLLNVKRGNSQEIIGICPAFGGKDLNGVFHLGAPSKKYGYDLGDITNDWESLYDPEADEDMSARRARHEQIPNWENFNRDRERIYNLIVSGNGSDVMPVIRLKMDRDGIFTWNYNDLEGDLFDAVSRSIKQLRRHRDNLFPSLGSIYASALSPDINQKLWNKTDTYPVPHGSNNMGATQAWPYVLWRGQMLLYGKFMKALVGEALELD